jgi:simple sugar transport system substrate-binding protein
MYLSFPRTSVRRFRAPALTRVAAILAAGGAMLVLSTSGSAGTTTGSSARPSLAASVANPCAHRPRYFIYYATDAFPSSFYAAIQKGAEDGARDYCLKLKWTQSPSKHDMADTVKRIAASIAEQPDVLIVSMTSPPDEDAAVKLAISKGIPVINITAKDRRPVINQPDYLTYIGVMSEYATGAAAAQAVLAAKKPALAVSANPAPKVTFMLDRVRGWEAAMSAAGVKTDRIDVSKNPEQVMKAYLAAHPSVDALYTLANGPKGSGAARQAIADLKATATIALVGTDYQSADLQAIQKGTQLAATTQQPYLQGYLAAAVTRVYFSRGQVPAYISAGPRIIDKSNIASVIAGLAKGVR